MKVQPDGAVSSGYAGQDRQSFESTSPTNGAVPKQMTDSYNLPTNMNTPGLKERGFRADQLVEMAGDDSYRLGLEAPRFDKIKG